MNVPEDFADHHDRQPLPDDPHWKALLARAKGPAIPVDFASRMQRMVETRDHAATADDWLIRSLLIVMAVAGVVLAGPVVLEPVLDGLRPLAEWGAWLAPVALAAAGAALLDRLLRDRHDAIAHI